MGKDPIAVVRKQHNYHCVGSQLEVNFQIVWLNYKMATVQSKQDYT
jgi:hypothetical protein